MKILVADDDPTYRKTLQGMIRKWGYEADCACDGEEAWQYLCSADGPQLAVLDWVMPSVDGLEVCRRARSGRLPKYVYIILLTARSAPADLLAGLEAGADDYLAKPPNLAELKLRIQRGCRILEREALQQNAQLHEAQLRRLFGDLVRAQDEEKRMVARELHEGIAQTLSGVTMTLSCLLNPDIDATQRCKMLSEAISAAQGSIRELQALCYGLYPPLLDEIGLIPALRSLGDRARRHPGVDLEINVQAGFGRLNQHVEMSLFRIVQQAALNLSQQFGCSHCSIRLERGSGEVRLEILGEHSGIQDGRSGEQGGPIPYEAALLQIKERAEQRGGSVEFQSNEGTIRILVTLPVGAQQE